MTRLAYSGERSLMRLQSRCWPGLRSSEGLTGAGGPTTKMAPSHGCWWEASVALHVGLSLGRFCVFMTGRLAPLRESDEREGERAEEEEEEATMPFMT